MKLSLNWGIKTNTIKFIRKFLIMINTILGIKVKTICFWPDKPITYDILFWICLINKYKVTNSLDERADIYMFWKDQTFHDSNLKTKFNPKLINLNCIDISKVHVGKVFHRVFGYEIEIDPTNYNGFCVQKNDLNAEHDGKIVKCPIEKKEIGFVYQKLINNQKDDNYIVDIRIPIFKDYIPFVYLKYRNIDHRFLNTNDYAKIKILNNILTEDEIDKIIRFCQEIKLEYGELDVLRDNDNGKIYIVDANHCPSGPPNHLSIFSKISALKKLSQSFDTVFG